MAVQPNQLPLHPIPEDFLMGFLILQIFPGKQKTVIGNNFFKNALRTYTVFNLLKIFNKYLRSGKKRWDYRCYGLPQAIKARSGSLSICFKPWDLHFLKDAQGYTAPEETGGVVSGKCGY